MKGVMKQWFDACPFASVFALTLAISIPQASSAEVYQFVDGDGVIHFTNVPSDPRFKRLLGKAGFSRTRPEDIHQMIQTISRKFRVDPQLVKAVIRVESDFDPMAVSGAGAMGLMQLMPATASTLGVADPFNPHENISGGVRHLSELLDRFNGDLTLSLAAYHAGAKRVEANWAVPPIEPTRRYVRKVMSAYRNYRGERPSDKQTFNRSFPAGDVALNRVPEPSPDAEGVPAVYEK